MNKPTPLARKLAALIEAGGPIGLAEYMAACLGDPQYGYYMHREPFGARGDFVTAPEISQMFGELIGLWCVAAWEAMGAPARFCLAELGPGRGTLMADLARAARLRPAFLDAAEIRLVETSPRLRAIQAKTLAALPRAPEWLDSIDALPDLPLMVIANEFFDALPIRQWQRTERGWAERVVGLDERGSLAFGLKPSPATPPACAALLLSPGAIVEASPAAAAILSRLAARIAGFGGAALIIDYGYEGPASGDTLQALRQRRYDDPLAAPGEADLTAHVDFTALAAVAREAGLAPRGLLTQRDFLLRLGISERAERLASGRMEPARGSVFAARDRLTASQGMGTLFKVLAIAPAALPLPAFDMG